MELTHEKILGLINRKRKKVYELRHSVVVDYDVELTDTQARELIERMIDEYDEEDNPYVHTSVVKYIV